MDPARVGAGLAPDSRVSLDPTPELARVVSCLAPARVRVHYPGVWLGPGGWATHGHYLDRHLVPEAAFGVTRGLFGRVPRPGVVPMDYALAGGPSLTRLEALVINTSDAGIAVIVRKLRIRNERVQAAPRPRSGSAAAASPVPAASPNTADDREQSNRWQVLL